MAPTGTISLLAGTTSGIEPMFAVAYARELLGSAVTELNRTFEQLARSRGFYTPRLVEQIAATGSVRGIEAVPADIRSSFPTALEIDPTWHIRMQAVVQRHVDAAVSKTVNLPPTTTAADVEAIFLEAWRAKLKGITVYRYGSRPGQILRLIDEPRTARVEVSTSFTGGCGHRACHF